MEKQRSNVDDCVDDLFGLRGQLGAVLYLMGDAEDPLDATRYDLRHYLRSVQDQVTSVVVRLIEGQKEAKESRVNYQAPVFDLDRGSFPKERRA